jgi:hypothetical protein
MPPGRPTLVVVSLGLDHNRRYGVGNGAGCFVSIRQLPFALGNKFDRICASRTPSPISPGHSRPKLIWPGLVEASWLQLCVVVNLAPKIVSVSIRTGRDRTGRIGAVNFVPCLPHADCFVRKWSGDQGSTSIVIIARQTIARGQHSLLLRVPNSVCGRRQSRAEPSTQPGFNRVRGLSTEDALRQNLEPWSRTAVKKPGVSTETTMRKSRSRSWQSIGSPARHCRPPSCLHRRGGILNHIGSQLPSVYLAC